MRFWFDPNERDSTPLMYDAQAGAIDQLTLLVDGKEMPAKLLPKDQARQANEAIVRPRPGALGMGGDRHVPDQRLSRTAEKGKRSFIRSPSERPT
jgi:hypothetical protein